MTHFNYLYACFFHESNNDNIHNLESMTSYENYAGIFGQMLVASGPWRGRVSITNALF